MAVIQTIPTSAYCTVDDLMLEGLPVNTVIDKGKYLQSSADEIDVILGRVYKTPITIDSDPDHRRSKLFLKQCNAQLASGRIILAVTISREADNSHALARQMIKAALDALNAVAGGDSSLEGATPNDTPDYEENKLLMSQRDPTSRVYDFEDRFTSPGLPYGFRDWESRRAGG